MDIIKAIKLAKEVFVEVPSSNLATGSDFWVKVYKKDILAQFAAYGDKTPLQIVAQYGSSDRFISALYLSNKV